MLFNSYEYIFAFLPITFFLYFYLLSKKLGIAAKGFLVFASLFFYSWWNIKYLPIILTSLLFNYIIGNILNEKENIKIPKKSVLIFGIAANLALLGYFKYTDFFISLIDENMSLLHIALPLAISFFTFQQIAYLVDSYRGETSEYNLLNYALFVTFFPQLIAGPIVHHKAMIPQFSSKWNLVKNYHNIAAGLFLFSIGLFKKVVIADTFATWANNGFNNAHMLNMLEAWVTSLSYTFQLYFDFSGYTDMAIGAALLFNIKLPINFNSPYKATSIQDFWRRWHITLSNFLRDYIYIPLGGNRKGELRTYTNIIITFVLGGLWHGAGWTFIFWGFLHGIALAIHRIWQKFNISMHSLLAWFITFNFINIAWVFFRAKEWDDAIHILKSMFLGSNLILPEKLQIPLSFLSQHGIEFGKWGKEISGNNWTLIWIFVTLLCILILHNSIEMKHKFALNYKTAFLTAFSFAISVLSLTKVSEFLYFNF